MDFGVFLCFVLTQLKPLPACFTQDKEKDTKFVLSEPRGMTSFVVTKTPQFLIRALLFNFSDSKQAVALGLVPNPPQADYRFSKDLGLSALGGLAVSEETNKRLIPDKWFAMDKVYHLIVSFSLVGSGYHLLANRINVKESYATSGSIGGTLFLGISKEIFDAKRPDDRFSYRDLTYDILGIAIGYFVFIH